MNNSNESGRESSSSSDEDESTVEDVGSGKDDNIGVREGYRHDQRDQVSDKKRKKDKKKQKNDTRTNAATNKRQVTANGRYNNTGIDNASNGRQEASGVPGLSVMTNASISSVSNLGSSKSSVSYNEISAVRGYVRSDIYPRKKTIFCDEEIGYGSTLSTTIIDYIMYAKNGFYRG